MLGFIYQDTVALHEKRLVVYNVPRQALADYFEGKAVGYAGLSAADSIDTKTYSYNLFPARLGYRALARNEDSSLRCIWKIGQSSLLYLKEDIVIDEGAIFRVDYLIVSNNCRYKGEAWQKIFQPKMVIIDGSLSRKKAIRWKEKLQELGMPVHWVQEDGAWVFPRP